MTDSGVDCCPTVSSDGRKIAFVRKTKGIGVDAGFGEVEANEIWIVEVKDRQPRMLARGSEKIGARLGDPRFSPEGNRVYFAANQGTVGAVYAIDVRTRALKFISSGNSIVEVVPTGKFQGCLVVMKHKYYSGGSYDWFWLLKPDGKEIAPLGDWRLGRAFCTWDAPRD